MSMSIGSFSFRLEDYLSGIQKSVYEQKLTLQGFLKCKFSKFNNQDYIEISRVFLDLVEWCEKHTITVNEIFFVSLLNGPVEIIAQVRKLSEIVNADLGGIFFNCVSSQKEEYHSVEVLINIIDDFHKMIPNLPSPAPILTDFPTYDLGGKELLFQIVKEPSRLVELIKSARESLVAVSLSVTPSFVLKNIISPVKAYDQMKSEAIQYLTSLNQANRLPMNIYLELFRHLMDGMKQKTFTSAEKKWIVSLVLLTTTDEQSPVVNTYTQEDFNKLLEEVKAVHQECGTEVLDYFCSAPDLYKANLEHVIHALKQIKYCYRDCDPDLFERLQGFLCRFSKGEITLLLLMEALEKHLPVAVVGSVEDLVKVDELTRRFSGSAGDLNVQFPLPPDFIAKIKGQYLSVQKYCEQWKSLCMGELVNQASAIAVKAQRAPLEEDEILQLVAIGRLAIKIAFNIYLYNTQIWTVLANLLYDQGAVAQVKTGEGKSMIVALLAFVKIMQHHEQGHIISSSQNLSMRDQTLYAKFFQAFGVSTSHICGHDRESSCFQSRILYGTGSDFEFAVMREMLYFAKLFPNEDHPSSNHKRFAWVIIDEVDNLTIDTTRNSARLSAQAEVSYSWVYMPILNFVKAQCASASSASTSSTSPTSSDLLCSLKRFLKEYMEGRFAPYVDTFLDTELLAWIGSARRALFELKEKIDYVVGKGDSIREGQGNKILIVDVNNTGRIMHGSRWSGGLHEFVEAKHNLEIQQESIVPISISHPVFYQMYHSIYGITGTIGSSVEREELKVIYGVSSFDVPTHNLPQRKDLPSLVFETNAQYLSEILRNIVECVQRERPILVLCKTIKDTEILQNSLQAHTIPFEMLNEVQKKKENEVLEKAGLPGAVTIATNTAGRGTDIKLTAQSLARGGLHVLMTFYPESDRVEFQARGRAGRQGLPGSSQIILSREKLCSDGDLEGAVEAKRIMDVLGQKRRKKAVVEKEVHIAYANIERYYFDLTKKFYQYLHQFNQLTSQEFFLETLAQHLNSQKIFTVPQIDYTQLTAKSHRVAEESIKYLSNFEDCYLHWKVLVKQISLRVQDAMINDFALKFYAKLDEMIHESGITELSAVVVHLKEYSELADQSSSSSFKNCLLAWDQAIKRESAQREEGVKRGVKKLFDGKKLFWMESFDESGNGLIKFLNRILNIKLTPIAVVEKKQHLEALLTVFGVKKAA